MHGAIGIYPTPPNRSPSFNCKSLFVLSLMVLALFETVAYFIEADSMIELGMAFSDALLEITGTFFCTVNMIRMPFIAKLIEHCEQFIDKSKNLAF